MVNMFSRAGAGLLALASLATVVNADLKITSPSSSIWWVAKSTNVLTWTCHDTNIDSFTVLVGNTNPAVQASPIAVIAIQQNFQCSVIITQDQANQTPGTGWQILFGNIVNNTDVYAVSDPFEIKPLGSLYPSQVTASANSSSPGSSATNSPAAKPTSAAASTKGMGMVWGMLAGAVTGAVGVML